MPVFWLRSYSLNSPSALWLEGEVFTSCRVLSHICTSCFISYCGEGWFSAASRTTFEYLSTRRFENFLAESNSVYLPSLPGSDLKSGFNFTRKTKKEKEGKKSQQYLACTQKSCLDYTEHLNSLYLCHTAASPLFIAILRDPSCLPS